MLEALRQQPAAEAPRKRGPRKTATDGAAISEASDEQSGQDKYSTEIVIQGYNSSLTMLGGGNTGGGIQNDNTQTPANNFEDSPQVSNDMDDEIPF